MKFANYDKIPEELKNFPYWCNRGGEEGEKKGKIPINPRTGCGADTTDPGTFAPLAEALESAHYCAGLGIGLFPLEDGRKLTCIDLDHCVNNGVISTTIAPIVNDLHSYTEISQSGTGLHIFFTVMGDYGDYKETYYIKKGWMECYVAGSSPRFIAFTGNACGPYVNEFGDRTEELNKFLETFMKRPAPIQHETTEITGGTLDDEEIIQRAAAAKNSAKFTALFYNGDLSEYNNDHSRADSALLSILAYWTGRDANQMERLFNRSALVREKWTEREDYRERSIKAAIENCASVYEPKSNIGDYYNDSFTEDEWRDILQDFDNYGAPAAAADQSAAEEAHAHEVTQADPAAIAKAPPTVTEYIRDYMAADMQKFSSGGISTGFNQLDNILGGGLYAGLYVVAAASSLGKTTFCHQIADNIAMGGNDVIYITMEQSALQMVCKSFARESYTYDPDKAQTALQFMRDCDPELKRQIATRYTKKVEDRLTIMENPEGNKELFSWTARKIIAAIESHMKRRNTTPVVFVDYLQIIQPEPDDRAAQVRQTIDKGVTMLKQFSALANVPIVVISSINRSAYSIPIELDALKESGGVEYTADVVIGLQLDIMNADLFKAENKNKVLRDEALREAYRESPREVECKILKNRFGNRSATADFNYIPAYDCFEEDNDRASRKAELKRQDAIRAKKEAAAATPAKKKKGGGKAVTDAGAAAIDAARDAGISICYDPLDYTPIGWDELITTDGNPPKKRRGKSRATK